MRYIIEELIEWLDSIIQLIPGKIGSAFRRLYFKMFLKSSGWNLSISNNVRIKCKRNIEFGDHINLMSGVEIRACNKALIRIGNKFSANGNVRINADCGGFVEIGEDVMIGPNVVIRASNHAHDSLKVPISQQGHIPGKIIIGSNVWIASNVVLLPNVKIGDHTIIAAGAVVNRDIPEYSIAAGIPAKVIKSRKSKKLLNLKDRILK